MQSTADCLRRVAELLDRGERAFIFMASAMGEPAPIPLTVPQELVLVLAAWFDVHPDADASVIDLLTSLDTAR